MTVFAVDDCSAQVIEQMAERDSRQFRFEEDYPKDYTPPPVKAFSMVPGIGRQFNYYCFSSSSSSFLL